MATAALQSQRAPNSPKPKRQPKSTSSPMRVWELQVGIEIHARILAQTKLFSRSSAAFTKGHGYPNSQVALFDAGMPGALPSLNAACVDQAIRTALALNGRVNTRSVFERKHYFYGDSPLGFQITQQRAPIVSGGAVTVVVKGTAKGKKTAGDVEKIVVGIDRIQLEQDTGRTIEGGGSKTELASSGTTLLDLNRAGLGLMEIVSSPDIKSAAAAAAFVRTVRDLLQHIGTCDGSMEEGSLRADINVSVASGDGAIRSPRIEVKNLNSLRSVERAVAFERDRLVAALEAGEPLNHNETRTFDAASGETLLLRRKETAVDYRFFPEPDLPALFIDDERIQRIVRTMPELFDDTLKRLMAPPHDLAEMDALVLLGEPGAVRLFDSMTAALNPEQHTGADGSCEDADEVAIPHKAIANLICNELIATVSQAPTIESTDGTTASVAMLDLDKAVPCLVELLQLLQSERLSSGIGKRVLAEMLKNDFNAGADNIAEANGWYQINDDKVLSQVCVQVLDEAQGSKKGKKTIAQYLGGKEQLLEYFLGQAMGKTKGLGNPQILREKLRHALEALRS